MADNRKKMKRTLAPPEEGSQQDYTWCSRMHLDIFDNFPFFLKNTPIDFPFIEQQTETVQTECPTKSSSDITEPELIDLNSLVIPKCFGSSDTTNATKVEGGGNVTDEMLVEEFKPPLVERPPPRRNPPRKAQLKKPSQAYNNPKTGGSDLTPKRASPKTSKGRCNRRRKQRRDRKQIEEEGQREFSILAHHNLHSLLTYINNVKNCNAWRGRSPQCNVAQASNLLQTACQLYCIANDIVPDMLAHYLSDIATQANMAALLKQA